VDHVIDVQDSRIASREGFYVGTSRGSESITVVTDDRDALVRRLERAITREPSALAVERALSRDRNTPERRFPTPPTSRVRFPDLPAPAPLRDLMRGPER
jgi:hypothetical protein